MRQLFRYISLFFLVTGPLVSGEILSKDLRIATFNLDNYLVMDRYVEGVWRPNYPKPEKEKAALRDVVLDVRPDILFMQEMGQRPFLEELRADLSLLGLDYPYLIHMAGPDQVRHLSVLSMLPPGNVVKHRNLDFKYFDQREMVKRGMLEVTFELPDGQSLKTFGLHLKSRYTGNKEDPHSQLRRTKEAEACRDRVIEQVSKENTDNYLILGDFNDYSGGATLRRFYKRGDLEIGIHLPIADSRGQVWTYFYKKQSTYSQVDGFVVSPRLLTKVRGEEGIIDDRLGGTDHRLVYFDLTDGKLVAER
ncbi:MAG: endonuclease/exonuclease/phosphatase family protein [Verrucomicrobiota bacterium]